MKINKSILKFAITLSLSLMIFNSFSSNVFAASKLWDIQEGKTNLATSFNQDATNPTDIRLVVVRIINVFLSFLGLIMVILILLAGFNWMTSRGEEDVVKKAKSQIKTAVIGLVIVLCSYVIVNFVVDTINKEVFKNVWY
jgi:cytochrome bd-type quinol oxidase subunit 2